MQLGLDFSLVEELVAGVDEVGRGPLCGPVVTAAVILDPARPILGLNDSKKLSEARRERLFDEIREKALAWCIGRAEVEEIDRLNILQATFLAMQRAVAGLAVRPSLALIDGNRCPMLEVPAAPVVRATAGCRPSPPPRSSPRSVATARWPSWTPSIRATAWPGTRAIRPRRIWRRSAAWGRRPSIGAPSRRYARCCDA